MAFEQDIESKKIELCKHYADQFAYLCEGRYHLIDVPPGWLPVVDNLAFQINNTLPERYKGRFQWRSIKEKFGKLNAYWTLDTKDLNDENAVSDIDRLVSPLISLAEDVASRSCMICSEKGERRQNDRKVYVSCEEHIIVPGQPLSEAPKPTEKLFDRLKNTRRHHSHLRENKEA